MMRTTYTVPRTTYLEQGNINVKKQWIIHELTAHDTSKTAKNHIAHRLNINVQRAAEFYHFFAIFAILDVIRR